MIELPECACPNGVEPSLIDYGGILRSAAGAASQRLDRKGSRFALRITYPPMCCEDAKVMVSRLLRAKREGLRVPFPLLGCSQGSPGAPVVNGAGQAGTTLNVRGLTPSYMAREGYWLSIVDANGRHYLHNIHTPVTADATGNATLQITPALRVPFADGAVIHLAKPMVEGFVDGDSWGWQVPVDKLIAVQFTMEEKA